MKKFVSLILTLVFLFALAPFAFASPVVLSPQKLMVDGEMISCEKYNIDGSNYFKLRDLAYALSSTNSQFDVAYDAEKNAISISTGKAYTADGTELMTGADKSKTAVQSSQKILINGEEFSNISAYNVGGNNYFKLRDLGDILGFNVDFDDWTNCAVVYSLGYTKHIPVGSDVINEYLLSLKPSKTSPGPEFATTEHYKFEWDNKKLYDELNDYFANNVSYTKCSSNEMATQLSLTFTRVEYTKSGGYHVEYFENGNMISAHYLK